MKKFRLWLVFFAVALPVGGHAASFICKDRIVSVGDSKAEVVIKCGEPTWKDTREEEIIEKISPDAKRKVTVTIDEWTYNLGPNAFIRILKFTNGKLTDIEEDGYGYADTKGPSSRCDEMKFSVGDTMAEVRIYCGEPAWKDIHKEEIVETIDKDTRIKVAVTVEEWTYNLGPNRFMRILKFRNGKLVEIKTGDYGY